MKTTDQHPDDAMPPCDKGAEKAVLGSIILSPTVFDDVCNVLADRDFYDEQNQKVYHALMELKREGKPIDHTLLIDKLIGKLDYDDRGQVAAFILEIARAVPTAAHAKHYAGLVKEASDKRQAQHLFANFYEDARNGKPLDELLPNAQHDLSEFTHSVWASSREGLFPILTSADLDTGEYNIEYIIDSKLVAGQPCIVAAAKKDLKTTIMVDLVISVAIGGYFLGKFRVNRACRVLMMTGESGLPTIQETARRIARAAGHNFGDIANLIWSDKLPRFGDKVHLDAFEQLIQAEELEIVVIDPTYMALPGADAGNLFIQGELLFGMTEVCQRHGVTLILVHHTRKGGKADPFAPPELEHIAWAGFQEWCRQWILIGRREKYEPGSGLHRLWLNCGGSAGHSSLHGLDIDEGVYSPDRERWWNVSVFNAEEVRGDAENRIEASKEAQRAAKAEKDQQRILAAILKLPNGKGTAREIREYAGISGSRWAGLWSDLLQRGHVTKVGTVKAGNHQSYDVFAVSDDDE